MENDLIQILDKTFKLHIGQEIIGNRIKELAKVISKDFKGKELIIISILNGAFIFTADLIKLFSIDCQVSFVKLTSYDGINRGTKVRELIGVNENLTNKHILIVEDIIDSGNTILQIKEQVASHNPSSISVAALLFKPDTLQYNFEIDYVGFEVENKFLVGYGLDYNGFGRGLNDIFVLVY